MSLIADALRAAQGEKSRRAGDLAGSGRAVAATVLRAGPGAARGPLVPPTAFPRPVVYALLGFGCALGVAAAVVVAAPGGPDSIEPVISRGLETAAPIPEVASALVAPRGDLPGAENAVDRAATEEPIAAPSPAPPARAEQPDPEPAARRAAPAPRAAPTAIRTRTAVALEATSVAVPPAEARTGRFQIRVEASADGGTTLREAVAARRRRDFPAAARLYEHVVREEPGNVQALNDLGTVYQAMGQPAQARDAYARATAADPGFAPAWSNLALVLGSLGEQDQAQAALAEAARLDPRNLGARVNLANQQLARGATAEATRTLQEVLRASPQMPEAHYALARALEVAGDRAGAVRHYELFLGSAGGRFPQLEQPVRRRIQQLAGAP